MREFGECVRAARDAREWTQEQLAEHAGMDRTTVSKIERGKGNPTLLKINRIARALEKSDFFPCLPEPEV
jgi:transcriptional regulator with XRE-family HTH domain